MQSLCVLLVLPIAATPPPQKERSTHNAYQVKEESDNNVMLQEKVKVSISLVGGSHIQERRELAQTLLLEQQWMDREVMNYARSYYQALTARELIYSLHVSKSAGSLLCKVAVNSSCGTDERGCHPWADRKNWLGLRHSRNETCRDLSAIYDEQNLTFVSNEWTLIEQGLCPQFWNIMVFRHPVSRLISHLSMLYFDQQVWDGDFWTSAHPPTTPEAIFIQLPILSNNYFIRSLLGTKVYTLPFGAVNETHLELAKRMIQDFDVIFVMDETNATVLASDIRRLIGFTIETEHERTGKTEEYRQMLNWSSAQWKSLEAANSLDIQLYDYATDLYKLDRQVFSHPAFSSYSAKWPTEDCGYLDRCKD